MLQLEHSAIRSTFIKLPFVIKIFVKSMFEWPLKTGFTLVCEYCFKIPHIRIVTSTCQVYDLPHYAALKEPYHV